MKSRGLIQVSLGPQVWEPRYSNPGYCVEPKGLLHKHWHLFEEAHSRAVYATGRDMTIVPDRFCVLEKSDARGTYYKAWAFPHPESYHWVVAFSPSMSDAIEQCIEGMLLHRWTHREALADLGYDESK